MSEPFHPILRTSRSEIAAACRSHEHNELIEGDGESLALTVEAADEAEIARIATKLGDILMDGGDYWLGLPMAAEDVLGVQFPPPRPEIAPIESAAPIGPRSRESGLASAEPPSYDL